jgi:AcrR family transcriptional regulator
MPVSPVLAPLPGARSPRDPQRAIKRGPSRVPREQVAATQRDRLYDGLVRTVAERGYANASVSDICRASGVTRPAFYEHFESKQGAFLAAYRHGTDVLFAMLRQAFSGVVDVLASVPAFATAAIVEIDAVGPEGRLARREQLRDFEAFFALAPATPPSVDRTELVNAVVAGAYGTLYRYIAEGRAAELPNLLSGLAYFVIAPFAGPEIAEKAARAALADHPRSVAPCVPAQAEPGVGDD